MEAPTQAIPSGEAIGELNGSTVMSSAQRDLLNVHFGPIGRTVSTKFEPNTSSKFYFWVTDTDAAKGSMEIGSIVAAVSDDDREVTFGTVIEMRSYSDVESFIADFLSHDFGSASVRVPTDISEVVVVTAAVMRNLSATAKPVGRSTVYFPSELGIQLSYGLVDAQRRSIFAGAPIPIGVFENGDGTAAAISVDENFLLGPEGAHLNVSGISGLAAKTSAIQFAVKSVLTHTRKRVAVVMVNVKSKDLLYIDQPNRRLDDGSDISRWSCQAYNNLGVPQEPFLNARFFAPASPSRPGSTQSLRDLATERFEWDLQMLYRDIPSLFSSYDWDDKLEGAWFVVHEEIDSGRILTYSDMLAWITAMLNRAGPNQQWIRGAHVATWHKLSSHLQRFPRSYRGLIATAGQGQDIPWAELADKTVFVLDIQMLNDAAQKLVFSRSIRTLSTMLEEEQLDLDAVVVFVDELNRFAPSGSIRSPLKSNLINITARGRSIGLVLFGAEQFASAVDQEVVENSSTFLFGRTETNELRSPTYAALSDEQKTKLTMLPQGHLLAKFPKFSQPIFLRFPLPSCLPGDQYESPQQTENAGRTARED